jgi:hypothetical protein
MKFRGRQQAPFSLAGGDLELPGPMDLLIAAAVREMLARSDAAGFLEWIRREGPAGHPGVFVDVPAPELWPSLATKLGVALWDAMPFPHNGFRPDPLPAQKGSDACLCRSGKKFGRCCARLPVPPPFPPILLWEALLRELEDEELIAAAASLQMPGGLLLELARWWQLEQLYERVLKLLEPVFRQLPRVLATPAPKSRHDKPIREFLEPLLDVFLDALMERGSAAKERSWRKRLLAELPGELQDKAKVLGV